MQTLSDAAERLWYRLITSVDDFGRLEADPEVVFTTCFQRVPKGWSVWKVNKCLHELATLRAKDQDPLILIYKVGTKSYLQIISAKEHIYRRAKESKYPAPADGVACLLTTQEIKDADGCAQVCADSLELRTPNSESRTPNSESRTPDKISEKSKIGDEGKPVAPAKSSSTWDAYSNAFKSRYCVLPVRNHKTNSLLCQLVDRLGPDAPAVAAFYVSHNLPLYVRARHAPNLLLRDAEGLHTQWATGTKVTSSEVRQAEVKDDAAEQVKRVEAMLKRGL